MKKTTTMMEFRDFTHKKSRVRKKRTKGGGRGRKVQSRGRTAGKGTIRPPPGGCPP